MELPLPNLHPAAFENKVSIFANIFVFLLSE